MTGEKPKPKPIDDNSPSLPGEKPQPLSLSEPTLGGGEGKRIYAQYYEAVQYTQQNLMVSRQDEQGNEQSDWISPQDEQGQQAWVAFFQTHWLNAGAASQLGQEVANYWDSYLFGDQVDMMAKVADPAQLTEADIDRVQQIFTSSRAVGLESVFPEANYAARILEHAFLVTEAYFRYQVDQLLGDADNQPEDFQERRDRLFALYERLNVVINLGIIESTVATELQSRLYSVIFSAANYEGYAPPQFMGTTPAGASPSPSQYETLFPDPELYSIYRSRMDGPTDPALRSIMDRWLEIEAQADDRERQMRSLEEGERAEPIVLTNRHRILDLIRQVFGERQRSRRFNLSRRTQTRSQHFARDNVSESDQSAPDPRRIMDRLDQLRRAEETFNNNSAENPENEEDQDQNQ